GCLRNIDRVGRIGFRLEYIGNRSDWMNAIHEREHDAIGSPLHPSRGKVSAGDLEVVFPAGDAIRLTISGGWINCKVSITAVTGLVPLGKFNINFVLRVGANVMSRPVGEQSEHGCLIHVVDVALYNPLVSPKAHIVG